MRIMKVSFRSLCFFAVLNLVLLFPVTIAFSAGHADANGTEHYKRFLAVYGGPHAQPDFYHVLRFDMTFEDDTYIAVAALALAPVGRIH